MRITCTLLLSLLCVASRAQDITGIWRGSFVSADKKVMDLFNIEDRYKYEVQIDQHDKNFSGVTYSYKSTVFYGKASANGTINPATGKVMLQELRLLELKMSPDSYACWMVCFLQYTKNGDEEFLEGKFSSYRESDSSFCDRGTVFLKRVTTSDFYKEPFLAKREQEKKATVKITPKRPASACTKTAIAKTNTPKTNLPKPNTAKADSLKTKPPVKTPPPATNTAKTNTPQNKVVKPGTPVAKQTKPTPKTVDMKPAPLTATVEPEKKETPVKPIKPRETIIIPPVLKDRENEVVQTLTVNSTDITINIYDNGTIDHDTVSVYLDKKNIVNHQMLNVTPIVVKIKMDENNDYHELVMVADNLGDIPPNTSLMVVKAGDKRYEVRITSTEQKNAVVIFRYEKPH